MIRINNKERGIKMRMDLWGALIILAALVGIILLGTGRETEGSHRGSLVYGEADEWISI